ncbi:MAG: adenosine deaminase family protein [Acidobacteriaceae bacterium]
MQWHCSYRTLFLAVLASFCLGPVGIASAPAQTASRQPRSVPSAAPPEQRTARAFDTALHNGPLELHVFLEQMPKGADLHNHLTGAVYAETWIREAAEDNLCVDLATDTLVRPIGQTRRLSAPPVCGPGRVAASHALQDAALYDALVDAFSMRAFVPSEASSGHDHFFAAFGKFGVVPHTYAGEWLDEEATLAAEENTQYLELMDTPDFGDGAKLGAQLGWDPDLEQFRRDLLAHGLRNGVAKAKDALTKAEQQRDMLEHCGQPNAAPSCAVTVRFLFQVLRGFPKEQVFAQMLLGFEVASAVPDVVGVNIVMPEDGYISMRDYHLQMQMFDMLHRHYPQVHLSLHAGELAPGLVPPEGLRFHVRQAMDLGHAERIGHGVDVMYEDRPYDLLREMAQKHVMVEINLTSNDEILGVKGADHPFPIYRRYGVPVALSTDDEGVSRIDLTHEYVRAVESYGLHYADLKQMARTSLEHAFLPGASLWPSAARTTPEAFTQIAAPCAHDVPGAGGPSRGCAAFLAGSQKAQQQWELEGRFHAFEGRY